ncbi:MAG TPA: hypothetical protein VK901_14490 [Nitrospiraceae bacterium]|nr:hypothetical protein [Nitrospiraceae bacterium]
MSKAKKDEARKTYAISLNRDLMLEVQHLALDHDRFINEMTEEALHDLVKKYRDKSKGK